jgi:uncharacterized iron-regulated membrane protein
MNVARRRQLFTAIHRYFGLATLGFLFIAAVTGCLLCVDTTIDAALNPDLFKVEAAGPTIAPIEAVARLERARPDIIVTQFPLRNRAGRTIKAVVAPRLAARPLGFDQLFLDPHDGRIVGTRQSGPGWDRRHIMDAIFSFHYTLLAGTWGRWLMGVAALGWLIGNGVGFYLTLPVTGPFWRKWWRSWKINPGARLRFLLLDIHRSSGLWLFVGVMLLAFTSVAMNFFDEATTPIATALSPARPSPFDKPAPTSTGNAPLIGFDRALARANAIARQNGTQWQPAVQTYLPDRRLYGVMYTASGYEAYRGLGPVTYYVDGRDGHFVYADDPYRDSGGRKFSRALYPLHSGEVVGPIGGGIVFLLGLATAEMCITGVYTWWKKRRSRLPRKAGVMRG